MTHLSLLGEQINQHLTEFDPDMDLCYFLNEYQEIENQTVWALTYNPIISLTIIKLHLNEKYYIMDETYNYRSPNKVIIEYPFNTYGECKLIFDELIQFYRDQFDTII